MKFRELKVGMPLSVRALPCGLIDTSAEYARVEAVGHDWAVIRCNLDILALIEPRDVTEKELKIHVEGEEE